jgi:hypothetical protein
MIRDMMKHSLLLLSLVLSSSAFAGGMGHATGGIADNTSFSALPASETPQKILASKAFNTAKIDLTDNQNITDAYQTGVLTGNVKPIEVTTDKSAPVYTSAGPHGTILTRF